uniref:hypothetical protein n=1 Tax=Aliarcobacter sp. TaxID=2321116 RepID=UPI00404784A4
MDSKVCNTCKILLNIRNKVKNRCVCKKCFKEQKAEYDKKRDRRKTPTLYVPKCKFCLHEFETYKHDKEYCSNECKRRYKNAARRVSRRK